MIYMRRDADLGLVKIKTASVAWSDVQAARQHFTAEGFRPCTRAAYRWTVRRRKWLEFCLWARDVDRRFARLEERSRREKRQRRKCRRWSGRENLAQGLPAKF